MTRWLRRIMRWAILVGAVRLLRATRRGSRTRSPDDDAPTTPGIRMSATNAPPSPAPSGSPAGPAPPGSPHHSGRPLDVPHRGGTRPVAAASAAPRQAASEDETATPASDAHADVALAARPPWPTVAKRAWETSQRRQLSLLAAGVAFYAFTSLFPAIIATIMIYGLVADPTTIQDHAERLSEAVPEAARQLVLEQVASLATVSRGSLSLGLVVALLVALWGASGAVGNLMGALNVAYGTQDRRPFAKRRGIALGLTASLIVGGVCLLGIVAIFPAVQRAVDLDGTTWAAIGRLRWVLLMVMLLAALTVLYRVGPDTTVRTSWRSPGAITATGIWLVASFGFSYYVSNFSNYGATYGSLAAVVVLLMWLWLTFYIILLGASINVQANPVLTAAAAREAETSATA